MLRSGLSLLQSSPDADTNFEHSGSRCRRDLAVELCFHVKKQGIHEARENQEFFWILFEDGDCGVWLGVPGLLGDELNR